MNLRFVFALSACLVFWMKASANNIMVSNVTTSQLNGAVRISFDISWENSWRVSSTNNYDGAWVFLKFKDNDGSWNPLPFTGTNISAPAGFTVTASSNSANNIMGLFIHRSANGFGTANAVGVKAGIQSYPGVYDVKVFALEMVYVPQGGFYVGNQGESGSNFRDGSTVNNFQVTGNGSTINYGTTAGKLNDSLGTSFTGNLNGFPAGYNAFWIMKYELSMGAYRDYLNTLNYTQQTERLYSATPPNSAKGTLLTVGFPPLVVRGRLEIETPGDGLKPAVIGCDYDNDDIFNEATDGEGIAMGFLNWTDVASYLDWACLRPMTEFEFEKAARGPAPGTTGEFAWGTDKIASSTDYILANAGLNNESVSNSSSIAGNAVYDLNNPGGVVRNGIFATAYSTRVSSGAGYYGAMELAGNLIEYCVTSANAAGRSYTGKHGDGVLDNSGCANVDYWPGIGQASTSSFPLQPYNGVMGVTAVVGVMTRGGSYLSTSTNLKIGTRTTPLARILSNSIKTNDAGIRGVRDAN